MCVYGQKEAMNNQPLYLIRPGNLDATPGNSLLTSSILLKPGKGILKGYDPPTSSGIKNNMQCSLLYIPAKLLRKLMTLYGGMAYGIYKMLVLIIELYFLEG